jgi:hypothetical protein
MRDIRSDLRARLAAIEGRRVDETQRHFEALERIERAYKGTIESLDKEKAIVRELLEIEERRELALPALERRPVDSIALVDFLLSTVRTFGPLEKDELREKAHEAGYFDVASGRTFHTTLMNITKGGKLKTLEDGRYTVPIIDGLFEIGGETKEADMRMLM